MYNKGAFRTSLLTIFAKRFILDAFHGPQNASDNIKNENKQKKKTQTQERHYA